MIMATAERPRLRVESGDRAPLSYGMASDKSFYSFEAQAGRPAALILAGSLAPAATASIVDAFRSRVEDFARYEADVLLLVDAQGPRVLDYVADPPQGPKIVYCPPETFHAWGFHHSEPSTVVTDRNLRVMALIDGDSEETTVETALACVAAAPAEAPRDILLPAPVLLLPDILSAEFCRALIDHFESSAHTIGGMASIDALGKSIHKIDETKKKREDYVLPPDHPLGERVLDALSRICLPEMKKAFQCDISHVDRIIIARYDDTGGYFRRHRDNSAQSVAFRQFALSLNLNSEDYEGGYLLFPEYNSHRYKPARGAGVVFSASLLHEATPVTKGRRYVLLTFLHNSEGEARRLAFMQRQEVGVEGSTGA
jgi:predicted 2-oxoglutarate/Fe(II)-dependent dioxygenase YbiX